MSSETSNAELDAFGGFVKRFLALRSDLFEAIERALKQDSHCKGYEGQLAIHWPNYFDDGYTITLDCCVVGPSRHYAWSGKSFSEALDKADEDIRSWIDAEYE